MNNQTQNLYLKFRACGMGANQALRAAKIKHEFDTLESRELVRLRCEDERENYFDTMGPCEAYTNGFGKRVTADQAIKEMEELLEHNGCHWCVAEYFDGNGFEHADSIGMCAGYNRVLSPFENWYIVDLMAGAIEKAREYINEMAAAV